MSCLCDSGDSKLDNAVTTWLKHDMNPITRQEVLDDVANAQWEKLRKTMMSRQKFGTAGLRGRMGAGYKCMNDVVVIQTAQGLCSYIGKECHHEQLKNGIVVGYDGRYNSKRFAELTAKVFVTANIPVHIFSTVCPTPLVSFATMLYRAAAGVMVTASHNPKEDNGYKVYWGNGCQIITPHDDNILEEILTCLDIPEDHWNIDEIWSHDLVKDCTEEVTIKYMVYIRDMLPADVLSKNKSAGIDIVYSAMHGVGYNYIVDAFKVANLKVPISVKEQQDPDPEFPTVIFPNPEETECLELSKELGLRHGVRLVLANDPDADRLAVAECDLSSKTWKVFTGNEMGSLLGWWLLRVHSTRSTRSVHVLASIVSSKMLRAVVGERGQLVETLTGFKWMVGGATMGRRTSQSLFQQYLRSISLALNTKMFQIQKVRRNYLCRVHSTRSTRSVHVLASIVSSKMLRAVVGERGQLVETLTGFKWMGNATLILLKEGHEPLFAFEEAIGYMCDPRVPDKDGVSAAVQVASLASYLYAKGSSLADQLQELYKEFGYHVSHNSYYICHDPATIQKIFRRIRNYHGPGIYPKKVGSCEIVSVNDFTAGYKFPEDSTEMEHLKVLGTGLDQDYTSGEMIMFKCSNGLAVTVRTSGTEPKLKYYTELVCEAPSRSEQEAMQLKLKNMVQEFVDELLQPKENELLA